jgi:hypothetical protein
MVRKMVFQGILKKPSGSLGEDIERQRRIKLEKGCHNRRGSGSMTIAMGRNEISNPP